MILAAENLLHVLRIHKYFSTVPPPERVKPNATKEFSFRNIIYYLIFQELPNYCLVRCKHCYTSRWHYVEKLALVNIVKKCFYSTNRRILNQKTKMRYVRNYCAVLIVSSMQKWKGKA